MKRQTRDDKGIVLEVATVKQIRESMVEHDIELTEENLEKCIAAVRMCAQVGADHAMEELHLHLSGYYRNEDL